MVPLLRGHGSAEPEGIDRPGATSPDGQDLEVRADRPPRAISSFLSLCLPVWIGLLHGAGVLARRHRSACTARVRFPYEWAFEKTLLSGALRGLLAFLPSGKVVDVHLDHGQQQAAPLLRRRADPSLDRTSCQPDRATEHPRGARPGGRVVAVDGRLLRFAQDDGPKYGSQVFAFEITELDETTYREVPAGDRPVLARSGSGWNRDQMHTWMPTSWLRSVDCLRGRQGSPPEVTSWPPAGDRWTRSRAHHASSAGRRGLAEDHESTTVQSGRQDRAEEGIDDGIHPVDEFLPGRFAGAAPPDPSVGSRFSRQPGELLRGPSQASVACAAIEPKAHSLIREQRAPALERPRELDAAGHPRDATLSNRTRYPPARATRDSSAARASCLSYGL